MSWYGGGGGGDYSQGYGQNSWGGSAGGQSWGGQGYGGSAGGGAAPAAAGWGPQQSQSSYGGGAGNAGGWQQASGGGYGSGWQQQGSGYQAGGAAAGWGPQKPAAAAGYQAAGAAGGWGAPKPAAAPKAAPKPAAGSWGYPAAAKPAAQGWQQQSSWQQPQQQSWQQPQQQSWQQPAKPAAPWGAQSAAKPAANQWGAYGAKPAAKPVAVAKPTGLGGWGAQQAAAKPAAAWGGYGQVSKPAPQAAAIQQAKAAAEALRQQALARRPGMPGMAGPKPMASRFPGQAGAAPQSAMAHVRMQQQGYQPYQMGQPGMPQANALKLQQERAALAAKAAKEAAAKLAAKAAARPFGVIPKVAASRGLPKAPAKPGAALSPATTAALAALAAAAKAKAKAAPVAAKPKVRSVPWVDQIAKLSMTPWTLVDRPSLDLLRRFPSLKLAPDTISVTAHFAGEDWRGLVQLDPLSETLTVDEEKDQVREEDIVLSGDKKRIVRVALMTGKLLTTSTHMANKIQFVLHKASTEPASLPGGPWDKADGADPEKPATLKKTAVRIVKQLYGVDLSKCDFHRFLDVKYTTEEGEQVQTTVLVPNIWSHKDLPLKLGRIVKEVEKEFVTRVAEEEPMTEEDKEKAKKEYTDRIAKQRAEGQRPRPGEREAARVERLEKLEETLKELEKAAPVIKETKTVMKEVKETKTIKQELSKPTFLSLQTIRDLSQHAKEGPAVNAIFETKLFALCFDEMIRLENGLQIIKWMHEYKGRAKADSEARAEKHKRDREQIQERDKLVRERLAKRQKKEQEKKAAEQAAKKAEAEKATMKEAERLEFEQLEKEKAKEKDPEATEESPKEEEDLETPLPALKLTKYVYDVDEEALKPFLYFDCSAQAPCGSMARSDLLHIFHRTGEYCQREVQDLVKATLIETPGARSVGVGTFSYRGACSTQREVEQTTEPAKEAAKEDGEKKEEDAAKESS